MSSEVEICNLALSHLGDSATVASIDPPEGSAQAEHCARWYPIARNSLLEMHDWGFATTRALLAELPNEWPQWQRAYARPSDCLKLLAILPSSGDCARDATGQAYTSESGASGNQIILTDQANAVARYTRFVTDTSKFSPLFSDTLGWYLSTYLAGPVLKGESGIKVARANMDVAMGMLAQAKLSDANQQRQQPAHAVPWLAGR
jgi:hypothetical protein